MSIRPNCEHVEALREPSKSHAIHKAECTKCYDNDESETGLNVCLTCFNGGCTGASQHSAQHQKVAGHHVVVNIRKVEVEQEVVPAKKDKATKLAITADDVFEAKYEYITKVRCLKCECELEKTGKLEKIVEAVLASDAATKTTGVVEWENKAKKCPHAETLVQNPDAPKLASKSLSKCQSCDIATDLWLCLTCGALGCSRDQGGGKGGNGHAMAHGSKDKTHHPLVIKVGTITPEGGASAYCYACDDDVVDSQLAKHLAHFGIDMASQEKTAKTMDELNVDYNNSINWSKVKGEDGKEAELMYGPGFCGFRNLGNSCYMASSLQVLYSLPTFQARYLGEGREHLANCRQNRPADCFQCQLSKVAFGIYSGRYNREPTPAQLAAIEEEKKRKSQEAEAAAAAEAAPAPAAGEAAPADGKEREVKTLTRKSTKELQPGVPPAMFKKFIAKNHYEFSTGKQQDALEFIHYFFEQIQRSERSAGVDPTGAFNFLIEDRLQCTQCQRVRYQSAKATELSLPIPLVEIKKAVPEDAAPGKKPEIEYAPAPFAQCLDQWSAEQSMDGYACPQCNARTRAVKRQRFESFPDVLMVQIRRFVFDNWVPAKVSAEVLIDREIKLDDLRGRGVQPGEVEFAAAAAAAAAPVKTANPEFVSAIEGMGLGKNLAIRACLAVDNASLEVALNWAMEHMGDDGVNDPIAEPKAPAKAASGKPAPPEDLVTNLMGMGFDRDRCVYALGETNNNLERAIDWLFSHAEEPLPSAPSAAAEAKSSAPKDTKPAKYRLVGFITHQGRSTGSGHYVAHLLKEGKWVKFNDNKVSVESNVPSGQAYLYFFRRV